MTYPQEAFEVYPAGVQRPVQVVYRVFDGVVLSNEIDKPVTRNNGMSMLPLERTREMLSAGRASVLRDGESEKKQGKKKMELVTAE